LHPVRLLGLRGDIEIAVDGVLPSIFNGGNIFRSAFLSAFNLILYADHSITCSLLIF